MLSLKQIGIPNHFIERLNMREQLIEKVKIFPLEIICRSVAAGTICTRLGLEEGTTLPRSIVEFCYKHEDLGDPLVAEEHITAFGWASPAELDEITGMSLRINDFLSGMFAGIGIKLIDLKLEFGRKTGNNGQVSILLADEISPDSCRLWDMETDRKLDKDRFRHDLGDVTEAYTEVATRLGILKANPKARPALSLVKE